MKFIHLMFKFTKYNFIYLFRVIHSIIIIYLFVKNKFVLNYDLDYLILTLII